MANTIILEDNNKYICILIFLISFTLLALELLFPLILEVLHIGFVPIYIIFYVMFGLGVGGFLSFLCANKLTLMRVLKLNFWLSWLIFFGFFSTVFIRNLLYTAVILSLIFTVFGSIMGFCFIKGRSHIIYVFSLFGSGLGVLFLWILLPHAGGENTLILLCSSLLLSNIILNKIRVLSACNLSFVFFLVLFVCNLFTHKIDVLKIMPIKTYNYSNPEISSWMSSMEKSFAHARLKNKDINFVGTVWSLLSRVDVLEGPSYLMWLDPVRETAGMKYKKAHFDRNCWISPIVDKDDFAYEPYPYVIAPKEAKVAIVGLGGGRDILQAKNFSPREVIGIEINLAIVKLMSYKNSPYKLLDKLYVMDGRGFFRNSQKKFDSIIFNFADLYIKHPYLMLDIENYLYTVEAIKDYFSHLSDNGTIYIAKHFDLNPFSKIPFELLRILSTVIEALKELGINDFQKHICVIQFPRPDALLGETGALLIKRGPFEKKESDIIYSNLPRDSKILYAPYHNSEDNYFKELIFSKNREEFYEHYYWNITPIYDNKPFLYQRYKDKFPEKKSLKIILVITIIVFLTTIVVPILQKQKYRNNKFIKSIIYFALLGMGFMIFEIALIQKFNLYLWSPIISMAVIIPALLISAGIGSYLSRKAGRRFISGCILFLMLSMLGFPFFIAFIMNYIPKYLPTKMIFTILILFPLGFLLGIPFPAGLKICKQSFGDTAASYMWAVNGIFSPLGAILAINLAMAYGFTLLFYIASILYILIFLNYIIL